MYFRKPAKTSRGEYTTHEMVIVTVYENDGRIGLGECAPLPDLSCDAGAYAHLSDVARLIETALASDDYTEFLRPYPALLFALESAIHDIRHTPMLYQTPFARSEVGIPTNGLVWMGSYDDMLAQVKSKLRQGHHCIKLKIGAIDWDEEIRLISLIRNRFSTNHLQLRVDANGAFAPEEAMAKMEQLAQYGIHSIEQPVQPAWREGKGWELMAELCKNAPLPIALDEELITLNSHDEKCEMLDAVRPQYIVVKPTLHGGMSGSIEWISEARKRGIGSWITSALESNIGLRNVALLAACVYGPDNQFAQGLGAGMLYTDNIEMDIEMRGSKLWRCEVDE